MAREFAKAFYNSSAWKKAREYVLLRDHGACVKCGMAAEEVHHKIWLTPSNINDPSITLDSDNLISLCGNCHKKIHRPNEEENEYFFDASGQLVKKSEPPIKNFEN